MCDSMSQRTGHQSDPYSRLLSNVIQKSGCRKQQIALVVGFSAAGWAQPTKLTAGPDGISHPSKIDLPRFSDKRFTPAASYPTPPSQRGHHSSWAGHPVPAAPIPGSAHATQART